MKRYFHISSTKFNHRKKKKNNINSQNEITLQEEKFQKWKGEPCFELRTSPYSTLLFARSAYNLFKFSYRETPLAKECRLALIAFRAMCPTMVIRNFSDRR